MSIRTATIDNILDMVPKILKKFPLGNTLTATQLDDFLQKHNCVNECRTKSTNTASWKRRVQERNDWRRAINNASKHGRLPPEISIQISVIKPGEVYEIKSLEEATTDMADMLPYRVSLFVNNRRKEVRGAIKHCDKRKLPAHLRDEAKGMLKELNHLEANLALQVIHFNEKYGTFRAEIEEETAKLTSPKKKKQAAAKK